MKLCAVPGCDRDTHARGLCGVHYQRDYRNGTPYLRPLDNGMLRIVRQLERPDREARMSVATLADRARLAPGSVRTCISHIRTMFGFTVIDGSPSIGYRLGEWPGRNMVRMTPAREARAQREREVRPRQPDSADGVVVTEAGRRLGL